MLKRSELNEKEEDHVMMRVAGIKREDENIGVKNVVTSAASSHHIIILHRILSRVIVKVYITCENAVQQESHKLDHPHQNEKEPEYDSDINSDPQTPSGASSFLLMSLDATLCVTTFLSIHEDSDDQGYG